MKRKLTILLSLFLVMALFSPLIPTVKAEPTQTTFTVGVGSDDAWSREYPTGWSTSLASDWVADFSQFDRGSQKGMRWEVDIPQGATIISAYLKVTFRKVTGTVSTTYIKGEAKDDPPTFSTRADYHARNRTDAVVSGVWTSISPDIKTVIQEIVDRPNFGDHIVLFWYDPAGYSGQHLLWIYTYENGNPEQLEVTWEVVGEHYIVDFTKTFTTTFIMLHETDYLLPLTFSPSISFTCLLQSAFNVLFNFNPSIAFTVLLQSVFTVLLSFTPSITFIILLQSTFNVLLSYTPNIAFTLLASAGYVINLIFQPSVSFVLDLVYTAYEGVLYIVNLVFAPTITFLINYSDLLGVALPSWLIELTLYPNWDIIILLVVSLFFSILFFGTKQLAWGYISFVGWLILGMIWLFINPVSYFVSLLFFAIAIIILALTLILQVETLRMVEGKRLGEERMAPV